MDYLIKQLMHYWSKGGLQLRSGVSQESLVEFCTRYGVVMPSDVGEYFSTVDGMDSGDMDIDNISFHSLSDVKTLLEDIEEWEESSKKSSNEALIINPQQYFVIADYLIYSHVYAIRLAEDASDNHVVVVCGEHVARVADSFSLFIEIYLSDVDRLVDPF